MRQNASFIPFRLFCLAMTATPGLNNMMVLAAAARRGLAGASVTTLMIWATGGSLLQDLLRNRGIATIFSLSTALLLRASVFALTGGWQ